VNVQECDQTLGERLRLAEIVAAEMTHKIAVGDELVRKLKQIAALSRPAEAAAEVMAIAPDARATVAAAQAFAARTRMRSNGAAA
jgi:uncharacterized protein DUF6468